MPRSRPATDPLSFHKHTGQYYVTRGGKRIHLGADYDQAMEKYHRLALGQPSLLRSSLRVFQESQSRSSPTGFWSLNKPIGGIPRLRCKAIKTGLSGS